MTTQAKVTTDVTAPLEAVPTDVVTLDMVCDKVVAERGCTTEQAKSMVAWVEGFVIAARESNYETQYPSTKQMRGRDYKLFDAITPHDAAAKPGSAHALLETHLLDPTKDEISLRHSQRERGGRLFCTIETGVDVLR